MPALKYVAARYGPPTCVAALGAVYLVGRLVYWRAHVKAPASRGLGYRLRMVPVCVADAADRAACATLPEAPLS